jgi:hypothetical protein
MKIKEYTLYAMGIKKRGKKINRHSFNLGNDITQDQVIHRTIECLDSKMRLTYSYKVIELEVTLEKDGLFTIKKFTPSDSKLVYSGGVYPENK